MRVRRGTHTRTASETGPDYVTQMLEGLGHWVKGADRGHLTWGIFHFQKSG